MQPSPSGHCIAIDSKSNYKVSYCETEMAWRKEIEGTFSYCETPGKKRAWFHLLTSSLWKRSHHGSRAVQWPKYYRAETWLLGYRPRINMPKRLFMFSRGKYHFKQYKLIIQISPIWTKKTTKRTNVKSVSLKGASTLLKQQSIRILHAVISEPNVFHESDLRYKENLSIFFELSAVLQLYHPLFIRNSNSLHITNTDVTLFM